MPRHHLSVPVPGSAGRDPRLAITLRRMIQLYSIRGSIEVLVSGFLQHAGNKEQVGADLARGLPDLTGDPAGIWTGETSMRWCTWVRAITPRNEPV
jgi:hypothetical protein